MAIFIIFFLINLLAAAYALARRRSWSMDAAALLLLFILDAGFYWRLILRDAYAPAGGGDLASFLYPYYAYAAASLRSGVIPFWNPYVFSGAPFIGDVQSGLFYPLNFLQFLFTSKLTYIDMEALAILHIYIAGISMYICLRALPQIKASLGAALLGAVTFMFSDLFILHFGNLNMIAVAAWLPLLFLFFSFAIERHSWLWAASAGLLLGVTTLAGHIQPTLYNALFLGGFAIFSAWQGRKQAWHISLQPIFMWVLATIIAVCISAPATFPAAAISNATPRAQFTYWESSQYSLSPLRSLGLLFPDLFGRDPANYWGIGDRVETGYIGILPLLLAAAGFMTGRKRPIISFFTIMAIVSFLFALGSSSLLHGWVSALVPGLSLLRAPARAIYLLDFSLAALAAVGCQAVVSNYLSDHWPKQYINAFLIFAALLLSAMLLAVFMLQDRDMVIFSRAWQALNAIMRTILFAAAAICMLRLVANQRLSSQAWQIWAILLVYFDLASAGAYIDLARQEPTSGFQHQAAIQFLHQDANPYRLDIDDNAAMYWQPDLGCLEKLENIRGVANPTTLARYKEFLQLASDRTSRLYDLLGAKYYIVAKGVKPAASKFVPVYNAENTTDIYLNTQALPLALIPAQAIIVNNADAAKAKLTQPDFDPSKTVIVENGPDIAPAETIGNQLWFTKRDCNTVVVNAELNTAAYVLVTIPACPGWQAKIDNQPAKLYYANLAFYSVLVPAGAHSITFTYTAPFFWISIILASLCIVTIIIWTLLAKRRHKVERRL